MIFLYLTEIYFLSNNNLNNLNSIDDMKYNNALKYLNFKDYNNNLVYGCYKQGLYGYRPYENIGEPISGYGGIMLVQPIRNKSEELYGYMKVIFSQDLNIYIGRSSADGTNWSGWNKV